MSLILNILFVDDVTITSDTVQNAEGLQFMNILEEAAAHAGLHCNTTKT